MTYLLALHLPPVRWRKERLAPLLAVAGVVLLVHAWHFRPLETEAYEYVEVAENFLRTGSLVETHLQNYILFNQPLVHPPGQRATLYLWVVLPFVWLRLDFFWCVAIPAIAAYLVLIWVSHRQFAQFPGGRLANLGALLLALHPRVLRTVSFEAQPDLLMAVFFVLAWGAFSERRYRWSGLWTGLAFLVKQNAVVLLPVFGALLLVRRREDLRNPRLWAGVLLFMFTLTPVLVRNAVVFGTPFYSENLSGYKYPHREDWVERNILKTMFRDREAPELARAADFPGWYNVLGSTALQAKMVLWWGVGNLEFYPGFVFVFFLVLIPFFIYGWWKEAANDSVFLGFWSTVTLLFFHVTVARGYYEDRYLTAILPGVLALALKGVEGVSSKIRWFKGSPFWGAVFCSEYGIMLALVLLTAFGKGEAHDAVYREFFKAGEWLKAHTPEDTPVMGFPISSASLAAGRPVAPVPYGGLGAFRAKAERYGTKYVLMTDLLGDEEWPFTPMLTPILQGTRVSVWRIEGEETGIRQQASGIRDQGTTEQLESQVGRLRHQNPSQAGTSALPTAEDTLPPALSQGERGPNEFDPLRLLYGKMNRFIFPNGSLSAGAVYWLGLPGLLGYLMVLGAGVFLLRKASGTGKKGTWQRRMAGFVGIGGLLFLPFWLGGLYAQQTDQDAATVFLPVSVEQLGRVMEAYDITAIETTGLDARESELLQVRLLPREVNAGPARWCLTVFPARTDLLKVGVERAVEESKRYEEKVADFLEYSQPARTIRIGGGVLVELDRGTP